MSALRAERANFGRTLDDDDALSSHRDDDELLLLQFGRFVSSEMGGTARTGLWQRLEIPDDGIDNACEPGKRACAQQDIKKMAPRRRGLRNRTGL